MTDGSNFEQPTEKVRISEITAGLRVTEDGEIRLMRDAERALSPRIPAQTHARMRSALEEFREKLSAHPCVRAPRRFAGIAISRQQAMWAAVAAGVVLVGASLFSLQLKSEVSSGGLVAAGVGVGDVKLGESRQQVEKAWGKAEQTVAGDTQLRYLNRGVEVMMTPKQTVLAVVCCMDKALPGARRSFAGQTAEGIRIGSTREAVERAYGNPDSTRQLAPLEGPPQVATAMNYDRGISFSVQPGISANASASAVFKMVVVPQNAFRNGWTAYSLGSLAPYRSLLCDATCGSLRNPVNRFKVA